jgi:signal transduction histidine kinase
MRVASGQALEEAWLRARLTPLTQAGARLVAAVDELTDLAQLQMGQPLPVHGAPVEIGALVQGVVSFLTTCPPTSERAGAVEITRPGPVVAWADRGRLERVLQNVVGNALKYSPPGTSIQVHVAAQEHHAVIIVRDHGIGIPAEEVPRLFTPFYRASTARDIAGSGLGLAGARTMLAQQGGQISVESALGCGTTVTICLPRAAAAGMPRPREEVPHSTDGALAPQPALADSSIRTWP